MPIIDNKILTPMTYIKDLSRKPTPSETLGYQALQGKFDQGAEDLRVKLNSTIDDVVLLDNKNIKDNGTQTINGVKTFIQSPIVPTPTVDMQSSTKKYVDDNLTTHKLSTSTDHDNRYVALPGVFSNPQEDIIGGVLNSLTSLNGVDINLQNQINTHKSSNDHDSRYYTETEIETKINILNGVDTNLQNQINTNDNSINTLGNRVTSVENGKVDKTTYDAQIINAGSSNSEVVDARGIYPKMKNRLDVVDSQLAEMETQSDITYYVVTTGNDTTGDGTVGLPFKTIQYAINKLPQTINHTVTINVSAGTYAEEPTFAGLGGKGKLTFNGGVSLATAINFIIQKFVALNNTLEITVMGFTANTTSPIAFDTRGSNSVSLNYCRGIAIGTFGAYFNRSICSLFSCEFSNKGTAVFATNCSTITSSNASTGTGNATGLKADLASTIGKSGTQPSGTTAESVATGGAIR